MKVETNLSDYYRRDIIDILTKLSLFFDNQKSFAAIVRNDIPKFLDSFRKPETVDPTHRWIGTYNIYRIHLLRFFKWLYYPNVESNKRPKPFILENIPQLRRKEVSIYKPSDLWTEQDDFLFLKYCPSLTPGSPHNNTQATRNGDTGSTTSYPTSGYVPPSNSNPDSGACGSSCGDKVGATFG